MSFGIHGLFSFLGMLNGDPADLPRYTTHNPHPSYVHSEQELNLGAAGFVRTLMVMGARPQVTYHAYDPGSTERNHETVSLPARIDIRFTDPHRKTHIVSFKGDGHECDHVHFFDTGAHVAHWEQPGYLHRAGTLTEILENLREMHPLWKNAEGHHPV